MSKQEMDRDLRALPKPVVLTPEEAVRIAAGFSGYNGPILTPGGRVIIVWGLINPNGPGSPGIPFPIPGR
jgi:hypothetical protein